MGQRTYSQEILGRDNLLLQLLHDGNDIGDSILLGQNLLECLDVRLNFTLIHVDVLRTVSGCMKGFSRELDRTLADDTVEIAGVSGVSRRSNGWILCKNSVEDFDALSKGEGEQTLSELTRGCVLVKVTKS